MRKRSRARVVLFVAIVLGVLAAFVLSKRAVRRPSSAERSAAGGAAEDQDDPSAIVEDARRYEVRTWSFPLARFELRIEDAAMTTALDGVLERAEGELAVNGGFFGPDGKPVGLAVSNGAVLSRLSKQMSGGVLTVDDDEAHLFAAETFDVPDSGAHFAVQCRPRLVVDGVANVKSDDGKRAERSALCVRDGGRVVDVVIVRGSHDGEIPGPSLFALAKHLAGAGCESALNLDGGPSTGVAWREDGGVKLLAPRSPVRHAIILREKR
ncbi:MAG: phosphodiester glycosidase family protein [Labilithrix sp.]|nr:phosphodiester glycosidase family protein [Labilithrix sp.]MCW5810889.1 phosphodiester glycosidase family protein [Labilithrix sp.]